MVPQVVSPLLLLLQASRLLCLSRRRTKERMKNRKLKRRTQEEELQGIAHVHSNIAHKHKQLYHPRLLLKKLQESEAVVWLTQKCSYQPGIVPNLDPRT